MKILSMILMVLLMGVMSIARAEEDDIEVVFWAISGDSIPNNDISYLRVGADLAYKITISDRQKITGCNEYEHIPYSGEFDRLTVESTQNNKHGAEWKVFWKRNRIHQDDVKNDVLYQDYLDAIRRSYTALVVKAVEKTGCSKISDDWIKDGGLPSTDAYMKAVMIGVDHLHAEKVQAIQRGLWSLFWIGVINLIVGSIVISVVHGWVMAYKF